MLLMFTHRGIYLYLYLATCTHTTIVCTHPTLTHTHSTDRHTHILPKQLSFSRICLCFKKDPLHSYTVYVHTCLHAQADPLYLCGSRVDVDYSRSNRDQWRERHHESRDWVCFKVLHNKHLCVLLKICGHLWIVCVCFFCSVTQSTFLGGGSA